MKFQGIEDFTRRLKAFPAAVKEEAKDALAKSATEITAFQKAAVRVSKGTLRNSIRWEFGAKGKKSAARAALGEEGLVVTIMAGGPTTMKEVRKGSGVKYDYALAQELGTQDQAAQPFFRPGVRLGKKRARSRISRAVVKGAKKAAGR